MLFETVIGLEIHVQLNTQSKIFSGSSTRFGAEPNTQASPLDLAIPGTLPVLNIAAVHKAVKFGLAVNAAINQKSLFTRKNYFYPDLPKGYQISQLDEPIVKQGHMMIVGDDGKEKKIRLHHAHLEEDAGKSLHEDYQSMTGIDLNRAGTPLLEIVSEPDMRSADEAIAYIKAMHALVRYLDISDGNMQEGSFRCDVNISIRKPGTPLGTRAELKNINSFKFIEKAIYFEVERQIDVIEAGEQVVQETRLYDANKNETRSMRSKEEANDYRYFPDPDLLPIVIEDALIEKIRSQLPELPAAKKQRFIDQYPLKLADANVLTSQKALADYFEAVIKQSNADVKMVTNWLIVEMSAKLNANNLTIEQSPVDTENFAHLLDRIADNSISNNIAKRVFTDMWNGEGSADQIIAAKGLKQVTDSAAIEKLVDDVIASNPDQIAGYQAGQEKLLGFLVGQVMKNSQGKANPQQVNRLLCERLKD